MRFGAGAAGLFFLAVLATAVTSPGGEATVRGCAASRVHYAAIPGERGLSDVPWISTRGAPIVARIFYYGGATLGDERVNQSEGLVLYVGGRTPDGRATKILWTTSKGGRSLTISGRRLDGPGSFRQSQSRAGAGFPSIINVPQAGCWRLEVRTRKLHASAVVRAIDPPDQVRCEPTPVSDAGLAPATPVSSGIVGGWTWRTAEGRALMYTHGRGPDYNAKVLWSVRRDWGSSLELVGLRIDATGTFQQQFPAVEPAGYFPSIVNVPAPGCWLFRLRTGKVAGILVVRAIDMG